MNQEWTNWSGSIRFRPEQLACPRSEEELAAMVRRAATDGRTVRVVGAGHSSMPLVETRDLVGWRVLYRTVAADTGWLSPFHDRASDLKELLGC